MRFGGQNEFAPLKRLLLKHPKQAYLNQEHIDEQWRQLNYPSAPDFNRAIDEYELVINIINRTGAEILYLPEDAATTIDSIYPRDALVATNEGMILCNMGKADRNGEPNASAEFLRKNGVPILGAIEGGGRLEGGDLFFLDEQTIVVGRGYRTNDEGIRQLRELTKGLVEQVIVVPLPHWKGVRDVFHLMSFISPLDKDLAAVYSPLLPVPFREYLVRRGISLVEIPEVEFDSMGCNILVLEPRLVLMLAGNPQTEKALRAAGVEVTTYNGDEISHKGEGGPTCLARPILRG